MSKYLDINTYKNIHTLDEYISLNKDALYICSLGSTTKAMNYKYGSLVEIPIIDIGSMIRNIFEDWETTNVKIYQKLKLKEVIGKLIEDNYKGKKNMLKSIKENLDDIISSIRLLCECGIYPEDIKINEYQLSEEEQLFLTIWEQLEKNDESILKFKTELFTNLEDENYFKEKFSESINKSIKIQLRKMENLIKSIQIQIDDVGNKVEEINRKLIEYEDRIHADTSRYNSYKEDIERCHKDEEEQLKNKRMLEKKISQINIIIDKYNNISMQSLPSKIIFQGFYFITPIQERIIQLIMKNIDVNITFLNHYNKDYKEIFDVWRKTFSASPKFGYPEDSKWKEIKENEKIYTWADKFATVYCENSSDSDIKAINSLKLFRYENLIHFNSEINSNIRYYSPDYKSLNEALDSPNRSEVEGIKRLVKSPLGNFIKYINYIWEQNIEYENIEDITYDIELLKKCFSTGWIKIKKDDKTELNACDYIYKLDCLKMYIGNNFSEKELKIKLSKRIQDKENLQNLISDRRCICSDIVDGFKFYEINDDDDYIIDFVNKIGEIIENLKLGVSNNKIQMSQYFNNIKNIVETLSKYKEELDESEKDTIEKFIVLLKSDYKYDSDFYLKDIMGAIDLFIDIDEDEDDINENNILDLKDISMESIIYEKKDINICQITDENMPGIKSRYTWPLSSKFIKKINCDDNRRHLLNRIELIIENSTLKNKYIFFNALQSNNNINISCIKNINDESIKESVYIKLISDFFSISIEDKTYDFNRYTYGNDIVSIKDINISDIGYNSGELIENIVFNICPKKWIYFLASDKLINYESEFHQSIYFSRLINVISEKRIKDLGVSDNPIDCYDKTLKAIGEFFPQWSSIEKMDFKENAFNYRFGNRQDTYYLINNNKNYSRTLIPNVKQLYGVDIRNIKLNEDAKGTIKLARGIPQGNPRKDSLCMWCSYIKYCRDGNYEVDLK